MGIVLFGLVVDPRTAIWHPRNDSLASLAKDSCRKILCHESVAVSFGMLPIKNSKSTVPKAKRPKDWRSWYRLGLAMMRQETGGEHEPLRDAITMYRGS